MHKCICVSSYVCRLKIEKNIIHFASVSILSVTLHFSLDILSYAAKKETRVYAPISVKVLTPSSLRLNLENNFYFGWKHVDVVLDTVKQSLTSCHIAANNVDRINEI